ncbi:MAG: Fur family transcriptional regulator [Pseudomonadota bacterium]
MTLAPCVEALLEGNNLIDRARQAGAVITPQREIVCRALQASKDHPDAEQLHERARRHDPGIALATVYRLMRALLDYELVIAHDFGDGRTRYELNDGRHHDHLICMASGRIIEFHDAELEALKHRIAKRLGYELEHHSLELYGRPRARR